MPRFLVSIIVLLLAGDVFSQELRFSICENCWSADSLGNHRAVLEVFNSALVAKAAIPWRRRDYGPESKAILVTDQKGKLIRNVKRVFVNRELGEILFEPSSGPGLYYVYYLKYWSKGRSNYPNVIYPPYSETADAAWLEKIQKAKPEPSLALEIQAIDDLNSFYPMEVIAKLAETSLLIEKNKQSDFLVFPEDRLHPVKMKTDLPQRWIQRGPQATFAAQVMRGENFAFQLGVFAHRTKLENVTVRFEDMKGPGGSIPAAAFSSINTSGVNWDGASFEKTVNIAQGNVQPLWCIVTIPSELPPGDYTGAAIVQAKGTTFKSITLQFKVNDRTPVNGGVDEPWKQTRLAWLNSQLGAGDEVIAPYTPLQASGNIISLLGRSLELSDVGLPAQIVSYFSPLMTKVLPAGSPMIARPFDFFATVTGNGAVTWTIAKKVELAVTPGAATWSAIQSSEDLRMEVTGRLEPDGFMDMKIKVIALREVDVDEMGLAIPMNKTFSKYMMGLGAKGGVRPASFDWTWDVANKNQDGAWVGSVHGGLQFSLRDENYSRPLNTNFYLQKPLVLPKSWGNEGKGRITITEKESVEIKATGGSRKMKVGEVLYYNFTLLITPFHTLDTDAQWKTRFYHKFSPVDTVLRRGATVVNVHHANAINPYLNYPFLRAKEMKAYIDEAHQKGIRVKIYNTVRELSNHAFETPVLRSLGNEIYSTGKGGGFSWLQEHLVDDYIAAWFVPELKDAAVINSGMSRWHNYYVEGMSWLVQNVGIDGIYLDDVAFDRTTMKRIRRVLVSESGPGLIDLHSANQFNKRDGFNNSANLYMEHFPYLDRLWFGEYFDYDSKPDFWLTEVSGIPYGLMGEMLEKGGNAWRGMLYGMTNRMPWTENSDPRHLWKLWDEFGMQGTEMIGYWVENNPVKTDNPEVLATIYKKKDAVMVALASWAVTDVNVKLSVDWKALGMKPVQTLIIPEVKDFQSKQTLPTTGSIVIPRRKGLVIMIR